VSRSAADVRASANAVGYKPDLNLLSASQRTPQVSQRKRRSAVCARWADTALKWEYALPGSGHVTHRYKRQSSI